MYTQLIGVRQGAHPRTTTFGAYEPEDRPNGLDQRTLSGTKSFRPLRSPRTRVISPDAQAGRRTSSEGGKRTEKGGKRRGGTRDGGAESGMQGGKRDVSLGGGKRGVSLFDAILRRMRW